MRVSSGMVREEFVVEMDVAAEIAEIQEVSERGRDEGLCSVDFLFSDVAEHSF